MPCQEQGDQNLPVLFSTFDSRALPISQTERIFEKKILIPGAFMRVKLFNFT